MNRTILTIIIPLLVFSTIGCGKHNSALQVAPVPNQINKLDDPLKCRIYVIRDTSVGPFYTTDIFDGDTFIGTTLAKTYLCWERKPGESVISGTSGGGGDPSYSLGLSKKLEVNLQAGQVIYIRETMWFGGGLKLLSTEKGKNALKHC